MAASLSISSSVIANSTACRHFAMMPLLVRSDTNEESTNESQVPCRPVSWNRSSSLRQLSKSLKTQGYQACHHTVARLLRKLGYSLKVCRRAQIGAQHPDRDKQFQYIAELKKAFLAASFPVISID